MTKTTHSKILSNLILVITLLFFSFNFSHASNNNRNIKSTSQKNSQSNPDNQQNKPMDEKEIVELLTKSTLEFLPAGEYLGHSEIGKKCKIEVTHYNTPEKDLKIIVSVLDGSANETKEGPFRFIYAPDLGIQLAGLPSDTHPSNRFWLEVATPSMSGGMGLTNYSLQFLSIKLDKTGEKVISVYIFDQDLMNEQKVSSIMCYLN